MKLFIKDIFSKIKNSWGRFLSLSLIVALGVGFFAGVRGTSHDMLYTADDYYDSELLMDFRIVSTLGFSAQDIEDLKKLEHVEVVTPSYSLDALSDGEAIRIHALEKNMNTPLLKEGTMPQNENECLAEANHYQLGDIITLTGNNAEENLKRREFVVTGLVQSPMYIGLNKGITNIGNGKLSSYIYIFSENFKMDSYTEIYLTAQNTKQAMSYTETYDRHFKNLENELLEIKPILETRRYEEILEEVQSKITDAEIEIEKKKQEGIETLVAKKLELDNANYQLQSGKKKLEQGERDFREQKKTYQNQIAEAKATFEKNNREWEKNNQAYQDSKNTVEQQIKAGRDAIKVAEEELEQLRKQMSSVQDSDPFLYEALRKQYQENKTKIDQQTQEIDRQEQEFIAAGLSLETARKELDAVFTELSEEESRLFRTLNTLENTLKEKRQEWEQNQTTLQNGYQEYAKAEQEFNRQIQTALDAIEEQKEKLKEIPQPTWYLLDRTDNVGYSDYENDAMRVDSISQVFPIFFLLVAALVCLNTMTRLIEEERTQIGIYKAIGYKEATITWKYILYVIFASLFGALIGLLAGCNILPRVISSIYSFTYYLPPLKIDVNIIELLTITATMVGIIILVTLIACLKTLSEEPAQLLRPKAPKKGKKIFLEKIPFLWKKINFTGKVTLRNLFRYKKRIYMTMIGIAGCTALTLTGFGLRDSIVGIVKLQFEKLFHYRTTIVMKEETKTIDEEMRKLFSDNGITMPTLIQQQLFSFDANNKKNDVYIMVPENEEEFYQYITLQHRKDKEKVTLNDQGVVITEKLSQLLNIKKEDHIKVRDSNNKLYLFKVEDIVENYAYNYIYMNKTYYEKIMEQPITYNMIISGIDRTDHNTVGENLLSSGRIVNISFLEESIENFNTMIDNLNKIVVVILAASCLLAFVVLYNLTTINITERIREIATLKVLGFHDKEVSSYVYRETLVLTVMGIFLGLFLGIFLHQFVMQTAEMEYIMFQRNINPISYVFAFLVTILFSVIVQIATHFKLKKIDMIESLKSVE